MKLPFRFINGIARSITIAGLIIVLFHYTAQAQSTHLKVGIYQNAPKLSLDNNGLAIGFFPEILNYIAEKERWSLEYVPCVWKECLLKLESGRLDLMMDVAFTEDRAKKFIFNQEVALANWSRIYAKNTSNIKSILDLDRKRVAVVKESIQAKKLKADAQAFNILPKFVEVDTFLAIFSLIEKEKVDAGIVNRLFGAQQASNFNIQETGVVAYPSRLMFAAPKGRNSHILSLIDKHLIALKIDQQSIYHSAQKRTLARTAKPLLPSSLSLSKAELGWLSEHREIIIAFDGNYAPYSTLSEQDEFEGIAIDFTRELARNIGINIKMYPNGKWSELYDAALKQEVDVIATLVKKPDRDQLFAFTQPYITLSQYIITHQDNNVLLKREQLNGKKVALVKGYSTSEILLEEFPDIAPVYVDTLSEALAIVSTGNADATVAAIGMANHIMTQQGLTNLQFAALYAKGLSKQRYGVRKDWPELASILDKAMEAMSNRTKMGIFQRWMPTFVAREELAVYSSFQAGLSVEEQAWLDSHREITIAINNAWPPMDYVDEQGKTHGIGVGFIKALNKRLNGALKIVPGSWSQIYNDVKEKRLDALMDITPRPDRYADFNFTNPYVKVPHIIFARKDAPHYESLDDLNAKSVGIEKDFFIARVLKEHYPQITVVEYETTSDAIDAVSKGDVDAYIGNRAATMYIIEHELISNLKGHGKIDETASINAIGVRKDRPILKDILQKALSDISVEETRAILLDWIEPSKKRSDVLQRLTNKERAWLTNHPIIRVSNELDWPPYDFNKNNEATGFSIEYLELIASELGIHFEFISDNWTGLIEKTKHQEIDIIHPLNINESRKNYLNFTDPIFTLEQIATVRLQDQGISSIKDLYGKRLAAANNWLFTKYIREKHPQIKLYLVKNSLEGLKAVQSNKADAWIDNYATSKFLIENHFLTNLKISEEELYDIDEFRHTPHYIAVRKDWPELKNIIQKTMDAISTEDKSKLYEKWYIYASTQQRIELTDEEREWLSNNATVRVAHDKESPPIEYTSQAGNIEGISIDYLKRIGEILNIEIELIAKQNREQTISAIKLGDIDIVAAADNTPEQKEILNFSQPYLKFPMVIVTQSNSPYTSSIDYLINKRVAVIAGSEARLSIENGYPGIEIIPTGNAADGLQAVSSGNAYAYIGDLASISHIIDKEGFTNLKVSGEAPYKHSLSIGTSKAHPILSNLIKKALAIITKEEQNAIQKRWFAVKYEQATDYSLAWRVLIIAIIIILVFTYWNRRLAHTVKIREEAELAMKSAKDKVDSVNKKLKDLDKLKSMFIASMSHELRTPLNSIIGFTGMLLQGISGELNNKQEDNLRRVYKSGKHLLSLITDVIDISKIESGRVDIFPQTFPLKEVVDEAIETIQPQLDSKELSLTVKANRWPEMETDRKRLFQCLLNYLSNAVKYSEKGSIDITVTDLNDDIEIKVKDTGIGISEKDMPKLFEAFERMESHLKVKSGGTGLGLYLTKKIITELLEGTIAVESRIGEGSQFSFTVPKKIEAPHEEALSLKDQLE